MAKTSNVLDDFDIIEPEIIPASIETATQEQPVRSPSEQLIQALTSDGKSVQNIYIESKKGVNNINIFHGNTPGADITTARKYYAQYKKMTLFLTDTMAVSFRDRMFYTDKADVIRLLESHEGFNSLFWKDKFPEWFRQKLEEKSKSLTRDPDAYK